MTEDLGKTAEYAICLALNTPFVGVFKYDVSQAERLANRFQQNSQLLTRFQGCIHSGARCPISGKINPPYDFLHPSNHMTKLSVKTIKTDSSFKICPQEIGQPSRQKFAQHFDIEPTVENIKTFIETNPSTMMEQYFKYTFGSPILFYHEKQDLCMFIEQDSSNSFIPWNTFEYQFSHLKKLVSWNESTTISIVKDGNAITIGEFQVHNHRNCVKFRFSLKNILSLFGEYFKVDKW